MEMAIDSPSVAAHLARSPSHPIVFERESWLSPALRDIVLRLPDHEGRTAERVLDAVRETVPEYRGGAAYENPMEVYRHCLLTAQTWHRALIAGRPMGGDDVDALFRTGSHKFRLGVSLPGLLQAFRIGSIVIWDELLQGAERDRSVGHEILTKVSRFYLAHFDTVSHSVGRGYTAEQQRVARRRAKALPEAVDETGLVEALSKREMTVLRLVEMGRTNKEIARDLFVSEDTVKYHLKNIYGKLGAHRRTEAVARAQLLGLAFS